MKEIMHFSHANGFPAETYRKFFKFLQHDFDINYLPLHAHHPDYPVSENWEHLAQELIDHIVRTYNQPVIGVGHSLGAVLTFIAAVKRPELFKCIVMMDAPILGYLRSIAARIAKRLNKFDRFTAAYRTKNRRTSWVSIESAVDYFKTKPLFESFDPDCLHDYIKFGMKKTSAGIQLRFDREIEYNIYRTLPHNLIQFRKKLKIPLGLLYGRQSDVVRKYDVASLRRHFAAYALGVEGGHLFPFEQPELAASALRRLLGELL